MSLLLSKKPVKEQYENRNNCSLKINIDDAPKSVTFANNNIDIRTKSGLQVMRQILPGEHISIDLGDYSKDSKKSEEEIQSIKDNEKSIETVQSLRKKTIICIILFIIVLSFYLYLNKEYISWKHIQKRLFYTKPKYRSFYNTNENITHSINSNNNEFESGRLFFKNINLLFVLLFK